MLCRAEAACSTQHAASKEEYSGITPQCQKKKSASFISKLTKMQQPIKLVVRITLPFTFLKQLSEIYFLSN
jgi:hypothetical protein